VKPKDKAQTQVGRYAGTHARVELPEADESETRSEGRGDEGVIQKLLVRDGTIEYVLISKRPKNSSLGGQDDPT
jgi:hypothetical protein